VTVRPSLPLLHAVTDDRVAKRPDLVAVAAGLRAGANGHLALHARGRGLSGLEHYELAVRLALDGVQLFVNDRLDVGLAAGATGVQLGRDAFPPDDARLLHPDWWIGVSVHDLLEAQAAKAAGADYLVVGPVYTTPSHAGRRPLGLAVFGEIAALGLPAVAIGGITRENAADVKAAGAYGVAAIRALWDAPDPAATARQMLEALGGT
jgi:thiamine-phosphate pyrophosphorylase